MANLTTTYMSRVLCKMEERERLKEIGIDLRRSRPEFPAWDELGEIPKVRHLTPISFTGNGESRSRFVWRRLIGLA